MAVCSACGSELEGELAFGVVSRPFEATVQAREEAEPRSGPFQGAAPAASCWGSAAPRKSGGRQLGGLHVQVHA
jgi:hypothetical protein